MTVTLAQNLREDSVAELRLRDVCAVAPTDPVADVVRRLAERRTGCALVMRDGYPVGIFTERDFLSRVVAAGLETDVPVERVMTPSPTMVTLSASVKDAISAMEAGGHRH